jgi:hypothetical protein
MEQNGDQMSPLRARTPAPQDRSFNPTHYRSEGLHLP